MTEISSLQQHCTCYSYLPA